MADIEHLCGVDCLAINPYLIMQMHPFRQAGIAHFAKDCICGDIIPFTHRNFRQMGMDGLNIISMLYSDDLAKATICAALTIVSS